MSNLMGYVLQRPARAFVIEQYAAGDEQVEAPPVEGSHLMGKQFGDAVGARGAASGVLVLDRRLDPPKISEDDG